MAAALIDGTPWPSDVARTSQGDRPSSVGKDGRSWGMVLPPDRPAVRGGRAAVPSTVLRIAHAGTPRPPGYRARSQLASAYRAPPRRREPLSSPGKPEPPALFKRQGAGRTSPRAESPRPMRQARSFSNVRTRCTRRLWPGRVNLTLGCHACIGCAADGHSSRGTQRRASASSTSRAALHPSGVCRYSGRSAGTWPCSLRTSCRSPMGRHVQPGGLGRPR